MSDVQSTPAEPQPARPARDKSDRAAQRRSRIVRWVVLALGLVVITTLGIAHQRGVGVVGVDALCPFGGIETLWSLITAATLLQRIAVSSIILLGIVVATALLFRRAFCGYVCPLGAIQEFSAKLGSLIFRGKRPVMPTWVDRPARWLKYVVLAGFTIWTWQAATLVLRPYDPWVAYMHITSTEVIAEFAVGLVVLGITVIGSVVYDRFFCKYACPMGAFLAAISWFSVFKVRRSADTCTNCSACDKVCPVNVTVSMVDVVSDPECINCNECVNVCPVKDTLVVSAPAAGTARRGIALSPLTMMSAVAALIVVALFGTTVSGSFAWTMPTLEKAAQAAEKTGTTINVEDIKGSMTFAEISKATGIPERAFIEKFGVTEGDMGTQIKELASAHGFDVHTDVREFVKQKLGSGETAK